MAKLLDQVYDYVQDNPALLAGIVLAVLIVGVTQAVVSASLTGLRSGALTTDYSRYELISRTRITHNTILYRFALPRPDMRLGLPLGRHLSLRAIVDGKEVRRPYTPTSPIDARGYFELLVKIYPAPHGLMSRHLESLSVGDFVEARGPLGRFSYKRGAYSRLNMVAGGTGITPMFQVLAHLLRDPRDTTRIALVFANVSADDILLREELDALAAQHPRFTVYYVLNSPPVGWSDGVGFVTKDMLFEQFGEAGNGALALMCGPPPMNKAMKGCLAELGYKDGQLFKF